MTPEDEAALKQDGHVIIKELPDGKVVALHEQIFTTALLLVTDNYKTKAVDTYWNGWIRRFCYEERLEALIAGRQWDGVGDPPGKWVKEKSLGVDRLNPTIFTPESDYD